MVKIVDAYYLRGYSLYDHLLDDSDLNEVIGREFRSMAAVFRALNKLKTRPVANHPYVPMQIETADGNKYSNK